MLRLLDVDFVTLVQFYCRKLNDNLEGTFYYDRRQIRASETVSVTYTVTTSTPILIYWKAADRFIMDDADLVVTVELQDLLDTYEAETGSPYPYAPNRGLSLAGRLIGDDTLEDDPDALPW